MDCPEHQKVKKDKLLLKGGEQITDIYLNRLLVNQIKSGKLKTFKMYQKRDNYVNHKYLCSHMLNMRNDLD